MYIKLNPIYILKPDDGRVLLLERESVRLDPGGDQGYHSFIHPIIAVILNCLDGSTKKECVKEAADILNTSPKFVNDFIKKLINNKNRYTLEFEGVFYVFPRRCLITSEEPMEKNRKFPLDSLIYEHLDLRRKRHATPTDITLMVNTICATDCFYCYADRRVKMNCKIPFSRLQEIIKEAYEFNARSINVIGGEFFLYKQWRELLSELKKYGFSTFLSTKVPIKEDDIRFLKEIDVFDVQVSLDTLIPEELKSILAVKDQYIDEMKRTLELMDQYGVKIVLHTILTSRNDNLESIKSIYQFAKNLKNLKSWRFDKAEASLYSVNNFGVFQPKPNTEEIYNYLKELTDVPVNYNTIIPQPKRVLTHEDKVNQFKNRVICSANYSHLFILPDGQVTTCEEFYWHPQFIVGNILEQSLIDIWTSDRCKYLALIPQKDIPRDSVCSTCGDYIKCHSFEQVCYRDVMKANGADKWYYPDIKCPKSTADEKRVRV